MLSAEIAHGHAEMLWARGDREGAQRRETQAREALDRAVRLQPTNIAPHIRLSQWLLAEYRRTEHAALLDDAMFALGSAEKAQAGAVPISVARFDVLQAKGDRKGAAGEMIRVLDRYPDEFVARQRLIQIYLEEGNITSAIATVDEAIERDPRSAVWYERKADLHILARDMRSAVASYRTAHHYGPTPARVTKFANAALALEQPDFMVVINTLIPDMQSLEGRPVLRSLYARALAGLGRKSEALSQMRIAYQEHRERADGTAGSLDARRTWLQILTVMLTGDGPDAVEQFTRETAGAGMDSMDLAWLAEMWAGRGPVGLPKALVLQRQAVDRCPEHDTALLARLLMAQGQYELLGGDPRHAAATFERIIEVDPDNGPALNNAAYLWAQDLNDPARALPLAERAKRLQPTNPDVLDTLGVVHFKLRNLQQAEEFLRQSVNARPSAESLLHLAQVQVAKGEYTTAETTLRRASDLNAGRNAGLQQEIDRLSDLIQQNLKR
jgi:tetratricopeptide (TPR) repeat protein